MDTRSHQSRMPLVLSSLSAWLINVEVLKLEGQRGWFVTKIGQV